MPITLQTLPLHADETAFTRWFAAVTDHQPGRTDAPLLVAAESSADALRMLWVRLQLLLRLVDRVTEPITRVTALDGDGLATTDATFRRARRVDRSFVLQQVALGLEGVGRTAVCRRAVMLHTDVALLLPEIAAAAGGSTSNSAPVRMYVGDGNFLGGENVSLHWEMARRVAGLIAPDPRQDAFVRRWYHATLLHAHATESFDSLQLRRGLELFPDDPWLLFAAGCEREAFASPVFQEFSRRLQGLRLRPDFGAANGELGRAERYFRRALEREPTFAEAAVHLGRVLGLRGQHGEAARLLSEVLDSGSDAFVTYYAALFLGAELEALQRPADARAAYERAVQTVPTSRVPHLALARLVRQSAERAETIDRLQRALAPLPSNPADEPWFVYRRSHARGADTALAEARQLAVEAGR